jgi:hypothetical protein
MAVVDYSDVLGYSRYVYLIVDDAVQAFKNDAVITIGVRVD